MQKKIDVQYNKLYKYDWLLIASFILAPMTGLRIIKVGPAELFCALWCIVNYQYMISLNKLFFYFWSCFLSVMFLGSILGTYLYPDESNMIGIIVWVYFAFISLAGCSILNNMHFERIKNILKTMTIGGTIWYLFLYIYSLFISPSFLGAPLWFGETRFSGGGTNPHQVALLLGCINVFLLYKVLNTPKWLKKLRYLLILFIALFLLIETQSSTGLMATIVGVLYISYVKFFQVFTSKLRVKFVFWMLVVFVAIVFNQTIHEAFMEWVSSDDNGMGRLEIFSSIGTAFWKSPIIGLGPGTHGINGTIEFHNTYLEIVAIGGVVGFTIFFIFTLKLFKAMKNSPLCISIMITMYIFGFAGFGMRRLVYWILLSIIFVYAKKDKYSNDTYIPSGKET